MNKENFKYLSECKDFDVLKNNVSLDELKEMEYAISLYKNDDIFMGEDSFGVFVEYQNGLQEFWSYKNVLMWYEGWLPTEDLLEYMTGGN